MSYRTGALAATITAFAVFLLAVPEVAGAQGAKTAGEFDEIVVTARRREESLQEVPLSISVLSGDQLARNGIADIIGVAQSVPNVTLEVSRGTNTTLTAFIRGVGQQDPVAGFESGVGIYIDDVYLNRPHAAVLDIYDVERIEVLRGPQGTLYGRNTIGGAIRYITRSLADEAEGKARFSVGNYGQLDVVFTASTPISDSFRIGGTIASLSRDGFGDNLTQPGIENYHKEYIGGRIRAEWDATDSLSFILSGDFSDDDSDPRQGHRLTVGNVTGSPILPNVFDTRAGLSVPQQSVDSLGGALTAQWTLNDRWMIKNILAYRDDESFSPIDFDSLEAVDLDVPVVYDNEQFSEELQLIYDGERLSGVAGFYMLDASAFNTFDVVLGQTGTLIGIPGLNANTLGDVQTDSWSVFADFSYDINDEFSVSVGGRYTSDERTSLVLRQTYAGGISPIFGGSAVVIATTSDFAGSKEFNEFSPRASLSWKPVEEHNFYVSYSEGFKGGSFDPRSQTSAAPDLDGDGDIDSTDIFNFMIFEPETVKSYEIGAKSVWADGRITSNVAVFFADYEDVQVPGSIGFDSDNDGTVDSFIGVTSNAGKADMTGIEFEGMARANDNWNFAWSIGYIDAEYTQFIDAFGVDVSDERVFQNTPELTASGFITYEMPMTLFSDEGSLAVITSASFRDDTSQFETPIPLLDQESYTLWDLSIVWEADDGRVRAGIHGKNLTDEEYKVAGYNFPTLGLEGNVTAFYGNPLTVTATVEFRF